MTQSRVSGQSQSQLSWLVTDQGAVDQPMDTADVSPRCTTDHDDNDSSSSGGAGGGDGTPY